MSLADVLTQLRAREPLFHRAEFGRTRADFERMTTDSFWEIGASGRRYDRAYVLDELEKRYAGEFDEQWETRDFRCQLLAGETYLLTYTLFQGQRVTRRATIWSRADGEWKAVYHQGTIVSGA